MTQGRWATKAAALVFLAVGAFASAEATGPTTEFSGEIELTLRRALPRPGSDPATAPSLFLHLERKKGRWQRVWGKGFTVSEHLGRVLLSDFAPGQVRLGVDMLILGDFWIKGRWPARFELDLRRDPNGRLHGTYKGSYAGRPVRGQAEGRILPPRETVENFQPVQPAERPRLLFRRSDLPALREKLRTPLGRAYRDRAEQAGDVINLGVLYQLTGDKAYADRARKALSAAHRDNGEGDIPVFGFGSGGFGHEIFTAAVAYDLCTDAWPGEFNDWMQRQLRAFTDRQQQILMTSHANFHPCSNYYGPGRGVPGVVSLALWGLKGPAPAEPRSPLERAWRVAPPEGFAPPDDAPVCQLTPGQAPSDWIWTGPLPYECSRDVLARIGGYAKAHPAPGTLAEYMVRDETWFKPALLRFQALPAEVVSADGIDLDKLTDTDKPSTSVYVTYLRADRRRTLRRAHENKETRIWLSGVELEAGRFYDVHAGLHAMIVEHRTQKTAGTIQPVLSAPDPNAAAGPLALYRMQRALWQQDLAAWERTGVDPTLHFWRQRGWFQNYQHYRWGIGDGGFFAETGGYAKIASWYPSVYAAMYPHSFGREVSAHPDVDHVIPRQLMQAVFDPQDRPHLVKLNSALTLNLQWIACHWPILPERYKPSVLWVWNRLLNVDAPDQLPEALATAGRGRRGLTGLTLAQTFVNYPLEGQPVHPAEGMPLTWSADTFGFYMFRSGWGPSATLTQVFAKASPVRGWNHPNAGAFTFQGLGHVWTGAPTSRGGAREQYSVVLLPDDKINQGSCGRVTHYSARPDGSGSITIDLDDVYAHRSRHLYDGMFNRYPSQRKPSGITGLRAIAFDPGGPDQPAVLALVDRIDGGGRKLWTWQRAGGNVSIDGQRFSIQRGDATLRGTFIAPGRVDIQAPGPERIEVGTRRHNFHGTVNRITAEGGDAFFVVCTVHKGPAPEVRVEGQGLDATVTVAGRILRFDGERIVLDYACKDRSQQGAD
jgi:hypothetical protein